VSTSLNLFLLLVMSIHLLRAVLAQQEAVKIFAPDDDSLMRHAWNFWNYEEGKECFNVLAVIIWMKFSNRIVSFKSMYSLKYLFLKYYIFLKIQIINFFLAKGTSLKGQDQC
jgi:hypothetical protein